VRMEVDVRSTDRILHARVQARQWYGGVRAARGGTKTYEHHAERCRSDEPSVLSAERSPLHIQSYRECHAVCFVCVCRPRTFLPRNDGVSRVEGNAQEVRPFRYAALAGASPCPCRFSSLFALRDLSFVVGIFDESGQRSP